MCFYYDDGYPEFWSDQIVRSKREHTCAGCRVNIRKGELYRRSSGKFDGSFYDTKTCGACELDRHRIHIAELADGCGHQESWCPPEELRVMLPEYEMQPSNRDEGQRWLIWLRRTGEMGIGTKDGWHSLWSDRRKEKEAVTT